MEDVADDDIDDLDDDWQEDGQGGEDEDDDAAPEACDGEEAADVVGDVEQLRRGWEDARESVRVLERSRCCSTGLLADARRRRDEAEARWRANRTPHPIAKRLRWAEAALNAAIAKQAAHQEEFDKFEAETAHRRKVLAERAEVDAARTARKREALDILRGHGAQANMPASERALRVAVTGIATDLGPQLLAAAERLGDDSPAWSQLQVAMATLQNVEGVLRSAVKQDVEDRMQRTTRSQEPPVCFDISGGTSSAAPMEGASAGGGTPHPRAPARRPQQQGGDGGCGSGNLPQPASQQAGGAGSARPPVATAPRWAVSPAAGLDKWGGPAWKRQAVAHDSDTRPGGADLNMGTPSTSERACEEARRLMEQRRQQGLAAAGATPAAPTPPANDRGDGSDEQAAATAAAMADAEAAAARAREEETERQRQQEIQRQREEVARAEAAEAERAERERQELLAKLTPEELRRAAELHQQQSAIAAAGFGTQQAAQGAGLVHQGTMHQVANDATSRGLEADADELMAMSPEELAVWNRGAQEATGAVPW